MNVDELLDEEAFDPKKLFNEEEYSTLVVKRDGFSKKENSTADLINSLLEKENTREEDEEIFLKLKAANSQKIILSAIQETNRLSDKIKLVAACWECGLDFTEYFTEFVTLATHPDFQLALEALSVVESTEGTIDESTLTKALQIAESAGKENPDLIHDLVENIKSRIA